MPERYDAAEVEKEYGALNRRGLLLVVAAVPLSVIALGSWSGSVLAGIPWLYRIAFGIATVAAVVLCRSLRAILDSGRPLRRPDEEPSASLAAQVSSVGLTLVSIPDSILILGFALRYFLGGTIVDYAVFLGIAVALWVVYFPRRRQFERWVRLRTDG